MLRNTTFCSFSSILIVLLTPFINKPDSSKDLAIYMISFISLFEITNDVCCAKSEECIPDSKIFLCIPVSAADAAAGNPNGIKTLVTNGLSTFFI